MDIWFIVMTFKLVSLGLATSYINYLLAKRFHVVRFADAWRYGIVDDFNVKPQLQNLWLAIVFVMGFLCALAGHMLDGEGMVAVFGVLASFFLSLVIIPKAFNKIKAMIGLVLFLFGGMGYYFVSPYIL